MPPLDLNKIFEAALISAPWNPKEIDGDIKSDSSEINKILASRNLEYAQMVVKKLKEENPRGLAFPWDD